MNDQDPLPTHARRAGLVTAGVVFLCLYGQYLVGFAPSGGDVINQYLPYQQLIRNAVRAGHWPLWNALTFCGRPLMGDIQVGVLYPPNWLHWMLPLPLSFALVLALHGAWMIAGCWKLGKHWGLAPPAIALGTALYAASPFFTLKMTQGIILFIYVGAWWPWLALAVSRLVQRPGFGRMAVLAVALVLSLLAGSPQLTFYGWIVTAALGVALPPAEATEKTTRRRVRQVLWMALAFAFAAGLSAVQTAQTSSFIGNSFERGSGASWDYVVDGSFAPRLFWLLLNPGFLGTGAESGYYWGSRMDFAESCDYLPLWLPAILTPLALVWLVARRDGAHDPRETLQRRLAWLTLAAMVLGVALAPGESSPLFKLFYALVPGFNRFRVPARLMTFYLAGAALLAALTYDRLLRGRLGASAAGRAALLGSPLALAALWGSLAMRNVLWTVMANPFLNPTAPASVLGVLDAHALRFALRGSVFLIAGAGAIVWLARARQSGRPAPRALAWALPALALLELAWLGFPLRADTLISRYREAFYPHTELIQLLEQNHRGGRVLWLDDITGWKTAQSEMEVYPNRLVMRGLPDVRGYDPVNARWLGEWMNLLEGEDPLQNPHGFMFVKRIDRPAWLALLGVETVLSYQDLAGVPGLRAAGKLAFPEGNLTLWRNERFRGMAFAAPQPRVAPPTPQPPWRASLYASAKLAENLGLDPLAAICVEPETARDLPPLAAKVDERFQVKPQASGPNDFRYSVDYPQPALLCLAQSAYDGWSARIDGKPAEEIVISGAFLATPVPQGRHEVVFDYEPTAFTIGGMTSLATLVALIYGLLRTRIVHRQA